MKRLIISFFTALMVLCSAVAMPASAAAVDVFSGCSGAADSAVCQDAQNQGSSSKNPVITLLKTVIKVVSFIIGVASIVAIVVGGIRFITSGGDPQAVANARSGIIYAMVGIVVAVLAQALVAFVLNKL